MNLFEDDLEFEALLDYLRHNRGCDLTGYKRTTLIRRFQHRMQSLSVHTYQHYLQYLQSHSEEYLSLLNDVLINVTTFFRDQETWDYLATEILPKVIASKPLNESLRFWSAGCAAGQEIYSLLILLAETLGIEACLQRVRCYATDADEAALQQARRGIYSSSEINNIPLVWVNKYFKLTEEGYVFHASLRSMVIFSKHDLTRDAPMSRIDLLMCRNVLMYFNLEAQTAILVRFHFALKGAGFLFVGKSETLTNRKSTFSTVDLKHRVYTKGLAPGLEDRLSITPKSSGQHDIGSLKTQYQFWQTAFDHNSIAQIAVNLSGYLVVANEQATLLFGLTLDDWNRPFGELEPGKLLGSHALMKSLSRDRRSVTLKAIEWNLPHSRKYFDIAIAPVFNLRQQFLGMALTFVDITAHRQAAEELQYSQAELAKVFERLQETRLELHTAQAELESAQQEIQLLTQNV